jgi:hypothetical protein
VIVRSCMQSYPDNLRQEPDKYRHPKLIRVLLS